MKSNFTQRIKTKIEIHLGDMNNRTITKERKVEIITSIAHKVFTRISITESDTEYIGNLLEKEMLMRNMTTENM